MRIRNANSESIAPREYHRAVGVYFFRTGLVKNIPHRHEDLKGTNQIGVWKPKITQETLRSLGFYKFSSNVSNKDLMKAWFRKKGFSGLSSLPAIYYPGLFRFLLTLR